MENGDTLTLALNFDITDGWHIYYKDPGDSGIPPRIKEMNTSFMIPKEVIFPLPEFYESEQITNYVHYGNVKILFPFDVQNLKDKNKIKVKAQWLIL